DRAIRRFGGLGRAGPSRAGWETARHGPDVYTEATGLAAPRVTRTHPPAVAPSDVTDASFRHGRTNAADADGMSADEGLLGAHPAEALRCGQWSVVLAHGRAKFAYDLLNLDEAWLIGDRLVVRPIEIDFVVLQREDAIGVVLAHGVEEEHVVDQFGLGCMAIFAAVMSPKHGLERRQQRTDA